MAEYISRITLPDGITYDVKDLEARKLIAQIQSAGISFKISTSAGDTPKGVTWTKGDTQIVGTLEPSAAIVSIYLVQVQKTETNNIYAEYICVKSGETYIWEKLGTTDISLDGLGDLAYKNSVSGSVEVIDSVSAQLNNGAATVTGTITPAGTVAASFTGESLTMSTSVTPKGTVVSTLGDDAVAAVRINYKPAGTVAASFSGSNMTSTGSFTPAGTITKPNINVTLSTTTGGASKVATTGTVTAGVAPSFTEGAFTSGTFTQGKDTFVAPTLTTSVANETLVINFVPGSFTQGNDTYKSAAKAKDTWSAGSVTKVTLPTFNSVDLVSGVSAALAAAPTFTGTEGDVSVTGTTAGSITGLSFTGTSASLSASAAVTGTVNSTFTGSATSISVTGTPKGAVGATFTGTEATVESSGAVTGNVAVTTGKATKTITSK